MSRNKYMRAYRRSMWPMMLLLVAVLVAALMMVAVAAFFMTDLSVQLNGSDNLVLEPGQNYEELGAVGYFAGSPLEEMPAISGQVDTTKQGTYEIIYTVRYFSRFAQAKRVVTVMDLTAPVITLVNEPGYYTEPGAAYVEEGFTAFDAVDGDLTDRVIRVEADGVVTYTVTDAAGNTTVVQRNIVYLDKTAPELVLLGDGTITITVGESFTDPGCTATDNTDGDITANILVSGAYDVNTAGQYTIVYTVTDSQGNSAEVKRTLVVEMPETQPSEPESGKVIYLTFDDGPGERTEELLQLLAKYNAQATFFVVGTGRLDYLDEILAEGHVIGLHANEHVYSKVYSGTTTFFNDLYALQEKVYDRVGVRSYLYRFPGGSSNTVSKKYTPGIMSKLTDMVEDAGFVYFDWHVDSDDAVGATTPEEIFNNVVKGVSGRDAAIVLQHDVQDATIDAMEMILKWGTENGYVFRGLSTDSPKAHHTVQN